MTINYQRVGWGSGVYVNPTNMNKMDNGIKATADAVDRFDSKLSEAIQNIDNVKANKTDLAVERERINNIASLPSGATKGDAELMDIRVGADGVLYSNAGESVRAQVNDLNKGVFEFVGTNLLLKDKLIASNSSQNITLVNEGDGALIISGKNTSSSVIAKKITHDDHPVRLIAGVEYTLASKASYDLPGPETFRLDVRPVNGFGTIVGFESYATGKTFTVPASGDYEVYLRINSNYEFPADGLRIIPTITTESGLTRTDRTRIEDTFRVCSLNLGSFSMGRSSNPAGTPEMMKAFKNIFREANANVYMFTEWNRFFDSGKTMRTLDIFEGFKPYRSEYVRDLDDVPQMLMFSDYPHNLENNTFYADGEARFYTDDVMLIGKKRVHFIVTHMPVSSQALRLQDMEKLKTYILNSPGEYFIVGGDFNISLDASRESEPGYNTWVLRKEIADVDVAVFNGIGMKSAQGGTFWGEIEHAQYINTYANPGLPECLPLDNFFYSDNLEIVNLFTVEAEGATDHKALVADFRFS